jgi:electron transport complex protein RnfG
MKDFPRIIIGLTVACVASAFIMGATFMFTIKAKKYNEYMEFKEAMYNALGYTHENPARKTLQFHEVYRYILHEPNKDYMGYMVPLKSRRYCFVALSFDGNFLYKKDLNISEEEAREAAAREKALSSVLSPSVKFFYANKIIIAVNNGKRVAYLLPRSFAGFKTTIKVLLALEPDYTIKGLEILEEEEDPGLGGEIKKNYFKNQFKGLTYQQISQLKVIKKPLPEEYRKCLEQEEEFTEAEIKKIRKKYQDSHIYALTGATITSTCVTNGVKNIVKKFAYRIKVLDKIIKTQNIDAVI